MTIARTICLGFIAVILAGTSLLMLPVSTTSGTWNDPIVALFTSTSAVCVTGLAVVDTGTYFSCCYKSKMCRLLALWWWKRRPEQIDGN